MGITIRVRLNTTRVSPQALTDLGLLTAGILLAVLGQRAMFSQPNLVDAIVYFGLALALVARPWLAGSEVGTARLPISRERANDSPLRLSLIALSLSLGALTFAASGNNTFTPLNVSLWVLSFLVFVAGSLDFQLASALSALRAKSRSLVQPDGLRLSWHALLVLAILALALFFYFYHLDQVPAEMTSDHAEKILDTYDVLHGSRPIFFPRNTGREPLQFYLNAGVVAFGLAPLNHIALKLVTALAGFLVVPFVYLLARELFGSTTGLLAAFFTAVSIWPVAIARVGLRFPFDPLFTAATAYFLVRAVKYLRRNDFLLAGIAAGVGLYGYTPFRVAFLGVAALLVCWAIFQLRSHRGELPRYVSNSLVVFVLAGLIFVPLLRYAFDNPDMFMFRALSRVGTTEQEIATSPVTVFVDNTRRALLMFNAQGDTVWVNTIPNDPVVDYSTGALILLGAVYALYRLLRHRDWRAAVLLGGGLIMMLPSTLSLAFPQENPSVVRAGGAIPFVMILAALPLAIWWQRVRAAGLARAGFVALLLLLFVTARANFIRYFTVYDDQFRRSSWNSDEVGAVMREFSLATGDPSHAYLISHPHWVDHRNVGIHFAGNPYWDNRVMSQDQLREQSGEPGPKLYILNKDDLSDLTLLRQLYPAGISRLYPARTSTREFVVFTVLNDDRLPHE